MPPTTTRQRQPHRREKEEGPTTITGPTPSRVAVLWKVKNINYSSIHHQLTHIYSIFPSYSYDSASSCTEISHFGNQGSPDTPRTPTPPRRAYSSCELIFLQVNPNSHRKPNPTTPKVKSRNQHHSQSNPTSQHGHMGVNASGTAGAGQPRLTQRWRRLP